MLTNKVQLRGLWQLKLQKSGEQVWVRTGENLITTLGFNLIALRLGADTPAAISHVAYGDDTTAASVAQTALLGTEHERVALTPSALDNEAHFEATLGSGLLGIVAVAEFGLFNSAGAGTMFNRFVTTAFNMDTGDTLDFSYQLAFV